MPFSKDVLDHLAKQTGLSPRQKQILALLFKGCSDKEIAQELDIRLPTVRTHMTRLFAKCGAGDRCELIIQFFKQARQLCASAKCPLRENSRPLDL
jgi:DNA-binding NarL/FixJ family response regulator